MKARVWFVVVVSTRLLDILEYLVNITLLAVSHEHT